MVSQINILSFGSPESKDRRCLANIFEGMGKVGSEESSGERGRAKEGGEMGVGDVRGKEEAGGEMGPDERRVGEGGRSKMSFPGESFLYL